MHFFLLFFFVLVFFKAQTQIFAQISPTEGENSKSKTLSSNRWPGSGYPVFLYKENKIKLYENADLNSEKKEVDVIEGERVDFGLSRIIVEEQGIISPNRPFYLRCTDEKTEETKSVRIEPPEKLKITYMTESYVLSEYKEMTCNFQIFEPDPLIFYEIVKPPKSKWWVEVHSNHDFKKGWVQVTEENFSVLPRLPSDKNHNNRRGITGDYGIVKIVSLKDKPYIRGFYNYWSDYNPVERKFKEQCIFFFQGPLKNDFFEIEAWFLKKKKQIPGKIKYSWRSDQSYLIVQLKKNLPGCSGKPAQIVEKPGVYPLIRETVWRNADLLKNKVKLALHPDRRRLSENEIDKQQPVLVLQSFRNWTLVEADFPNNHRGWVNKDDLYGSKKPELLDCVGFEDTPGIPFQYLSLGCDAQKSIKKKEFEKAEQFYISALKISLKDAKGNPAPNYQFYKNIADLRCRQKKMVESEQIQKDFLCMQRVKEGLLSCFLSLPTDRKDDRPTPNPELSNLCAQTLCKEPLPKFYKPFQGSFNARKARMKQSEEEIIKKCETEQ